MIGKLNHVAIVVPDLAAATAIYRDTLGAEDRAWLKDILDRRLAPLIERIYGVVPSAIRANDVSETDGH